MKLSTLKFDDLSLVQLKALYDRVRLLLSKRIEDEKCKLDATLESISKGSSPPKRSRRNYPQVLPKYQNPGGRSQTWAGRGRTPNWVLAQLKAG